MSIFNPFSDKDVIHDLKSAAPNAELITDADSLAKQASDSNSIIKSTDSLIAFVKVTDENDIKGVLKVARKYHLPVIPKTTGSSIVAGSNAIENGILISTEKMNHILKVDANDQLAVVQPGVINNELNQAANKVGMLYAPDPGSRTFSSIGGNTNTNAGGASALRYGTTKDSVLALTVILADGREIHVGTDTYKNSFGYDLTHLFVGAEGTLGIVTEITVKLFPIPLGKSIAGAAVFKDLDTLNEAATAVRKSGAYPSLMQAFDANILGAIDKLKQTNYLKDGHAMLIVKVDGSNEQVKSALSKIFNQYNGKQIQLSDEPAEVKNIAGLAMAMFPAIYSDQNSQFFMSDLTVPLSQSTNLIQSIDQLGHELSINVFTAAYVGDGTVHPIIGWPKSAKAVPENVVQMVKAIYHKTIELNGTITGEYSVGMLKNQWVNQQLGAEADYLQQQIKSLLDPMHLLNPKRKIN
ncbi:FAD-binding protein (plasmid) [Nicoliella spurrieriana]|uniref:FAD-binding protein n=1 Tax=Nicoliella spurrieriana TaxID=2925830 RepID=A0A976RQK8_9LACO|nr:FAD-binding protein [Nicoliella spurrieriana]UQS86097.1 FAD-binding protein [Nicoliella spurrieriana]